MQSLCEDRVIEERQVGRVPDAELRARSVSEAGRGGQAGRTMGRQQVFRPAGTSLRCP